MKKFSCLFVIIGLSGCVSSEENKQLADINKGWDLVIRASHVYPVYPLTQDLMPGDVFLVTNNISDTSAWSGNGFLALDRQILRLYPGGYQNFYSNSWPNFFSDSMHPPAEWFTNNSWSNAPAAGFPSYSFSVNQGAASSVSLPIHGIPIGLSLMEAKRASGFVTLEDAHTYGVDEIPLRKQVYDYIHGHPDDFKHIIDPDDTNAYYLQVVSRVYTVGQVSVSLFNDSAAGGSLWGGSPKNAAIPALQAASTNAISDAAANLSNIVNAVNATVPAASNISTLLPGGTLKFSMVSSRSVSMDESFPKPVVIGYLGFNVSVQRTGTKKSRTSVTNMVSRSNPTAVDTNILGSGSSNADVFELKDVSRSEVLKKLRIR